MTTGTASYYITAGYHFFLNNIELTTAYEIFDILVMTAPIHTVTVDTTNYRVNINI